MFSRGVCYYEPCSNTDITGEIMNHRVTSKEHILEHAMRLAMEKGVDYISIRKRVTVESLLDRYTITMPIRRNSLLR